MGGAASSQGGIASLLSSLGGGGGKGGMGATTQQQLPGTNSGLTITPATGIEALIAQRAAQQQMGEQIAQQLAPAAMYMDPSMAGALLNQRVSPDYAFAQQLQALKAPTYRESANYVAPAANTYAQSAFTAATPGAATSEATKAEMVKALLGGEGLDRFSYAPSQDRYGNGNSRSTTSMDTVGSYLPGGVNTANPGSWFNQTVANMTDKDKPTGAVTSSPRPISRSTNQTSNNTYGGGNAGGSSGGSSGGSAGNRSESRR